MFEEKTCKAVCEMLRAIRDNAEQQINRNNPYASTVVPMGQVEIDVLSVAIEIIEEKITGQVLLNRLNDLSIKDYIMANGKLVDMTNGYDHWYSDAPGGTYDQIKIYEYNNKYYVEKNNIKESRDGHIDVSNVMFYELGEVV